MYDQNNLTGGLQYVPQIAVQQVIYLDFDGDSTSYDGEILSIDGVEVAPSQLTAERIAGITAKLNERYASQGISFVTERPLSSAYSTIFVGKTAAFDRYGSFAGLAETIDKGNLNNSDKAFVLLDAADTDETIIATISHETDHLTGTLDHGGEGLAAYADEISIGNGTSSAGLVVGSDTSVNVYSGALLENATVNSGGSMTIYSGGTALMVKENGGYVTVKDGAHVQFAAHTLNKAFIPTSATLHEGTIASDATVINSGFLRIFSGGSANNTAVNGGGSMTLERGGIATSVTVRNGGTLRVSSGGDATAISAVSGAILQFIVAPDTFIKGAYANSSFEIKNGFVTSYTIQKQGVLNIVSGGAAITVTVGGDDAIMCISSGGRADSTTVTNGNLIVSSAGVAQNTTVNNGGFMTIIAGASAILIKENGGFVEIESGASVTFASNTFSGLTLSSGATLHAGTIASSTVLVGSREISGYLHIYSGGQAIDTTVNDWTELHIFSGGMANGVTANRGGEICISSGGVANNVTLADGNAEVSSGGTINMTTVNQYGDLRIDGGVANSTTVGSGGSMILSSGGVANSTTVADGGCLFIDENCIASSNTVEAGGIMVIYTGGTADVINVASGGTMSLWGNATAVNLIAASGARLHLGIADMTRISGEYAGSALQTVNSQGACYFSDYTIDHGGSVKFFQAGIGSNITVNDGSLTVSAGGQAFDTIVNSGGVMDAYAIANNVTVNSGGKLYIGPHATLTGTLDLGGQITVDQDTTDIGIYADVNLRLDQRTAGASALINDFSAFKDSNFTITIADEQEEGTYRLAEYGASSLADLTITISSTSSVLGTLTVGGDAFEQGEYIYTLTNANGALNFTVKAKSVPAPKVTADVTTLTNTDVVLTMTFSPKSAGNEYRIDGGEWQSCTTTTLTATQNGVYEFRSKNEDGTYSATTSYTVGNIDKIAPVITVTPSTTETVTELTLTATVIDGSGLQYSYDGSNWIDYTAPVLLTRSGTVYFKASDEAGNVATETIVVDNVKQVAPLVTADTTAATNGNVTLTIYFRPEGVKQEYSTDNINWQSCSGTLKVTANGTFYFRDTDADGNVSEITSYTVANIDKTAPDAPDAIELIVSEDSLVLDWTDVKDTGVAGVSGYYFRYGTSANLTGEGEFVDTSIVDLPSLEDGQWYFQVKSADAAGNESDWSEVFTAKVDRTAPVITLKTCADRPVAGTFIQATVDDGSPLYYSTDGVTYTEYTGIMSVFANGTWYFKAVDESGNTTIESVTLNNIDTALPNVPTVKANITDPTQNKVTLSADFTGFAVTRQWSLDGVKWRNYTAPQTVHSNVTLYFREIDIFGNVSEVVSYTVSNIDKTAPDAPDTVEFTTAGDILTVDWNDAADNGTAGVTGYNFRYGNSAILTGKGEFTDTSITDVTGLEEGTWYFQFQSVDAAGNVSAWSEVYSHTVSAVVPGISNLNGSADGLSWEDSANSASYVVEYSTDGFETAVTLVTNTCAVDAYALPAGTFQWRVRAEGSSEWIYGEEISAAERENAELLTSDADGDTDIFFGSARGVWEANYAAQHQGDSSWEGTGETVLLEGKNKIADIFNGSDDANTLALTDDANGDALFVDDIYTALGDQARFSQISQIRAGAGNDIVDMTSKRYDYTGSSIRIYGGDGDDTIWGGAETNILFGDGGNDRLAGASGNDILAGGAGDDSMHGGGGDDIFTFGADWGKDTVEQLATGSVTLWFAEGDESSWDSETMTYSDGVNSVSVTGCANVTLKFGAASDLPAGAFDSETSQKVFEDKGMLA